MEHLQQAIKHLMEMTTEYSVRKVIQDGETWYQVELSLAGHQTVLFDNMKAKDLTDNNFKVPV